MLNYTVMLIENDIKQKEELIEDYKKSNSNHEKYIRNNKERILKLVDKVKNLKENCKLIKKEE